MLKSLGGITVMLITLKYSTLIEWRQYVYIGRLNKLVFFCFEIPSENTVKKYWGTFSSHPYTTNVQ